MALSDPDSIWFSQHLHHRQALSLLNEYQLLFLLWPQFPLSSVGWWNWQLWIWLGNCLLLGKKRVNVMKVKAKLLILCSADQILQGTSWLRLDCLLLWVCRSYNIKCQWSGKQMHFRNRCLWYPFAPAMDLQLESCSGITLMHQVCLLLSLDLGLKASPGLAWPALIRQMGHLPCKQRQASRGLLNLVILCMWHLGFRMILSMNAEVPFSYSKPS